MRLFKITDEYYEKGIVLANKRFYKKALEHFKEAISLIEEADITLTKGQEAQLARYEKTRDKIQIQKDMQDSYLPKIKSSTLFRLQVPTQQAPVNPSTQNANVTIPPTLNFIPKSMV